MPTPKFKTPYNTIKVQSNSSKPSMTKQEFKDDCNPTIILKRFQATGHLEHAQQYEPVYGDQSSMSYHEALELTAAAQTQFQDLPASTRKLFGHDVGQYLDWVSNPENVEKLKQKVPITSLSTEEKKEETPPSTTEVKTEETSE